MNQHAPSIPAGLATDHPLGVWFCVYCGHEYGTKPPTDLHCECTCPSERRASDEVPYCRLTERTQHQFRERDDDEMRCMHCGGYPFDLIHWCNG